MAILEAEHLTIKQGNRYILNDVNWTVNPGENWILYGLNGCGKTTLLSIMAGFQSARQGDNFIQGEKVTKENFLELRRHIGFVSSSFFDRFLRTETVQEIVFAGKFNTLGLQGDVAGEDVRKAKHLLTQMGLKDNMRYPYDCLSKGQKQKVLIARALMCEPKYLILDEPCGGLDIVSRQRFMNDMGHMAEENGIGMVYVTHHTEEIIPLFTKAVLMKDGAFYAQGDMEEVFTNQNLTGFLGYEAQVGWYGKQFLIHLEMDRPTGREAK